MILIGRYFSPFVRRVGATLQHYGLEYEHRAIRAAGADQDEIRSHGNPLGRVPVLVMDSGEALADSAVILDYLDDLAGPGKSLMPAGGKQRFELQSKIAIANGAAEKAIAVFSEAMRPQDKQHQPAIDGNTRQAERRIRVSGALLGGPLVRGRRDLAAGPDGRVPLGVSARRCENRLRSLRVPQYRSAGRARRGVAGIQKHTAGSVGRRNCTTSEWQSFDVLRYTEIPTLNGGLDDV